MNIKNLYSSFILFEHVGQERCKKGEYRYPPNSDFFKLSKIVH